MYDVDSSMSVVHILYYRKEKRESVEIMTVQLLSNKLIKKRRVKTNIYSNEQTKHKEKTRKRKKTGKRWNTVIILQEDSILPEIYSAWTSIRKVAVKQIKNSELQVVINYCYYKICTAKWVTENALKDYIPYQTRIWKTMNFPWNVVEHTAPFTLAFCTSFSIRNVDWP